MSDVAHIPTVIPAQAGIHRAVRYTQGWMGPCLRRGDEEL